MTEKRKRATPWKDGKVISIRLRNGKYVLAQMLKVPDIVFFNLFNDDNSWKGTELSEDKILFCHAVTRQFMRLSSITVIKTVRPLINYKLPSKWIYSGLGGSKRVIVLNGKEREVMIMGGYHSLVEADMENHNNNTIHGLFKKILIKNITSKDWSDIENVEDMSVEIYPNLNERLYLCCLAGKNVNPALDIKLGKPIPDSYETYLDIMEGNMRDMGYID